MTLSVERVRLLSVLRARVPAICRWCYEYDGHCFHCGRCADCGALPGVWMGWCEPPLPGDEHLPSCYWSFERRYL